MLIADFPAKPTKFTGEGHACGTGLSTLLAENLLRIDWLRLMLGLCGKQHMYRTKHMKCHGADIIWRSWQKDECSSNLRYCNVLYRPLVAKRTSEDEDWIEILIFSR